MPAASRYITVAEGYAQASDYIVTYYGTKSVTHYYCDPNRTIVRVQATVNTVNYGDYSYAGLTRYI